MSGSRSIAVTGASGFVGQAVVRRGAELGVTVRPIDRGELWDAAALGEALEGAGAVIHLAGLAHRLGPEAPTAAEFDHVNRQLPLEVFRAARAAGVRRMVHVSTIHVVSSNSGLLRTDSPLAPVGPYAIAKAAAETELLELAGGGGAELVIVRPPLVYGPAAKGNLRRLMRLSDTRVPLPFGRATQPRSLVAARNLADALIFAATREAPFAAGTILHPTDGSELSLRDLVRAFRSVMGRPARLVPVPRSWLRAVLEAAGMSAMATQLLDAQQVDGSGLRGLGWSPPFRPEDELHAMVTAYLASKGAR